MNDNNFHNHATPSTATHVHHHNISGAKYEEEDSGEEDKEGLDDKDEDKDEDKEGLDDEDEEGLGGQNNKLQQNPQQYNPQQYDPQKIMQYYPPFAEWMKSQNPNNKNTQTYKPENIDPKYLIDLDLNNNKDADAFSGYGDNIMRYANRFLFIPLRVGPDRMNIKDRCNRLEGQIKSIRDNVSECSLHATGVDNCDAIALLHKKIYSAALQCDSLAKEEMRPERISEKIKKDFEASQAKLSIIKAYNNGSNPKNLTEEDIEKMKTEVHASLNAATASLPDQEYVVHEVLAKRTRYRVGAFAIFSLILGAAVLALSICGLVLGLTNQIKALEHKPKPPDKPTEVCPDKPDNHKPNPPPQDLNGNDPQYKNPSHQFGSYNVGTPDNPVWKPISEINDPVILQKMYNDLNGNGNPNNFQNQYQQTGSDDIKSSLYGGDYKKIQHGNDYMNHYNATYPPEPKPAIWNEQPVITPVDPTAGLTQITYTNNSIAGLNSDQLTTMSAVGIGAAVLGTASGIGGALVVGGNTAEDNRNEVFKSKAQNDRELFAAQHPNSGEYPLTGFSKPNTPTKTNYVTQQPVNGAEQVNNVVNHQANIKQKSNITPFPDINNYNKSVSSQSVYSRAYRGRIEKQTKAAEEENNVAILVK